MDDITLTQLFARMDAHLERQDAHLKLITETLRKQADVLVELTRATGAGHAHLAAMVAESQRIGREVAAMTAEVLRRAPAP